MSVLLSSLSEFCNKYVSFESRKGTCEAPPPRAPDFP
eukprot:CAMPEP_0185775632 /NCGR_PEP_ID=MMETSP1174-20130828/82736_1 /TAXON_ID=35687 /ORGANISM="Dictyocha speculum, Strain CCMP1381" /LENGTH=36 /DNA_ID= /DNA_START= /DNA_END= /DNA_ORIENTATION=